MLLEMLSSWGVFKSGGYPGCLFPGKIDLSWNLDEFETMMFGDVQITANECNTCTHQLDWQTFGPADNFAIEVLVPSGIPKSKPAKANGCKRQVHEVFMTRVAKTSMKLTCWCFLCLFVSLHVGEIHCYIRMIRSSLGSKQGMLEPVKNRPGDLDWQRYLKDYLKDLKGS